MDLLIKQARLEDDAELVDIAISEGKITAVAPNIEESAATTIEAKRQSGDPWIDRKPYPLRQSLDRRS